MSGKAALHVSIPQEWKAELEVAAARENLSLPDYVRKHLAELTQSRKIYVDTGTGIRIANPWPESFVADPQQTPPYMYPPYPSAPHQYRNPYSPPDSIDVMVNDMRKLVMVKIMQELLQGRSSAEEFIRAAQGKIAGQKNDGFDMNTWMRYNMMQQQHERSMMQATQQLEMARSRGDKGAENQAIQLMTALMANQSAQQQQFMQNFMATQQSNQTAQQTLFTTALQTQRSADADARTQQKEWGAQIETVRNQMMTGQMQSLNQMNQMHVNHLQLEMERIRSDKPKDTLKQLDELIKLRTTSPVYKAAFDAATGVTSETMIGKLIPQLKELGVDKLIERIGGLLVGAAQKPKIPEPGAPAIPSPTPITLPGAQSTGAVPPGIVTAPPQPPGTPLENLRLPPAPGVATSQPAAQSAEPPKEFSATPQPPETVTKPQTTGKTEQPESAIGYTNLSRPQEEKPPPEPKPNKKSTK